MKSYTQHFNTKSTPQTQPIPGQSMVQNRSGGFGFELSSWGQFDRFLILGTEGGTYHASEAVMTKENAVNTVKCIQEDGVRAVARIVEVSDKALAPKNDPAIFALALATTFGNVETKTAAYAAITKVCRIGTHLFQFCEAIKAMRGWSSGLRNGVSKFYESRSADKLAMQIIKYQQREGWSHFDVLRLAHPSIKDPVGNGILRYAARKEVENLHPLIATFEALKGERDEKKVIKAILEQKLPRECIPTEHLNSKKVWDALLQDMGVGAMVRNLGKMTSIGLIDSNFSEAAKLVVSKLSSAEAIKGSRIHPIAILTAMKIYVNGHGMKGSLSWNAVGAVSEALDRAFYTSFGNVEPTGKNFLIGLDVSGSMGCASIAGSPLRSCEVTAAMSMVVARTEANHEIMGFCERITNLGITPSMSLMEVTSRVVKNNFGATDVAEAIEYATTKNLPIDVFSIWTDNETYSGTQHVVQALKKHREKSGRNAKVIFCATSASNISLADPKDPGMLDIAGFSADVPQVISSFARS